MAKTRDLIKKSGDTKGLFHARMGMLQGGNSKDLTETKEIKKKWQEYTELCKKKKKKVLMKQITMIVWSLTQSQTS